MMFSEQIPIVLPPVLVDIVLNYAFGVSKQQIRETLRVVDTIKAMDLPFFMLKSKLWSWNEKKFVPNITKSFVPLIEFGNDVNSLFDYDACYCFLLSLDFRKRIIRTFGTRDQWLERLMHNWLSFEPFAGFYKMVLHLDNTVLKKRWYLEPYI